MFGLVGPNGAGKTSLIRILAGLIAPTTGSIQILGHDLSTSKGKQAVKAVLGYLPQELGVYPNLSAREFLDYIAILKGITRSANRQQQIEAVLEKVRLTEVAHRPLKTYSGGMKRRVGIAQAILGQPKLLIVDEPTTGLDPEERIRLRNLLSELAAERTVILSTHIIADISQSCNALAIIGQGRLLFQGSPQQLVEQVQGQVWLIETETQRPEGDFTLIASIQLQDKIQHRVMGNPAAHYRPQPVAPTLEDGYMGLMRQRL
ncbi:MAG: ATP-binding cassette domain-containing protein [Anaerolineae bacterium]|nr:ATP-binding cassette domain-containing protein [Anaerolineae bacterium]MCB9105996.1 ATP-binding cassette domain-containing protein [Anaerolineales bacterium]